MMNKRRLLIFALAVTFSLGGALSLLAQQKNMSDEGLTLPEGEPTMPATESPGETKGISDSPNFEAMMEFLRMELDLTEAQMQKLQELDATHMKQHVLGGRMDRPTGNPLAGRPMRQDRQTMSRGEAPMPSRGHRRMGPMGFRGPMWPESEFRPFPGDPMAFFHEQAEDSRETARMLRGPLRNLHLSQEQQEKICTIFEQYQDFGPKKTQNFLDMHRAMANLLKHDEFDEQQVRELFRRQSSQMEEHFVKRAKMLAEIREVLSSEQIGTLRERSEIFLDMMERRHGAR